MVTVTVRGTLRNTATEDTYYALAHDWHGHVEGKYPDLIPIDGTGHFRHVSGGTDMSEAAVVYTDGTYDWLVSWYSALSHGNKVYTEIREAGYFEKITDWGPYKTKLEAGTNKSENVWGGYKTTVEITAAGTSPALNGKIFNK
ncbi:hypothetical protein FNV43_RR02078 [Rhamnella rubrinervis]|uniref:Uncharacterized protein n=1 Tax=Rhamnella rubrinervis TaxID=2594499 RepID=A0A8K0HRN8_9ROSA|nr:hypothetical protein FNV43_RR02078 [Rhamnella rubrinervis]